MGRKAFVVYIDGLGTEEGQKDYEKRFGEFADKMEKQFRPLMVDSPTEGERLGIRGLSDSAFLLRYDIQGEEKSLETFFGALRSLQSQVLEIPFPLRGGVSYGLIENKPLGVLDFLGGVPIVQAARIEENLQTVGIAFAPPQLIALTDYNRYGELLGQLKNAGLIVRMNAPTVHGLIPCYMLAWADGNASKDIICPFVTKYMPTGPRMEKDKREEKDFSIAAKYVGAATAAGVQCNDTEEDGGN